MKVEFRINGGINFYFVCRGYSVVWEVNVVITQSHHFVLVFTQIWVRLREWISAVLWQKLIKHGPNIRPTVFNNFHMTLIHGELHRIFTRSPFCFPIHRKSPLFIKSPNHQKKTYDHTLNELGYPRPGITTSIITVNNLNPYYMKKIFTKATNLTHRPLDVNFNWNNTTKYRNNSLQSLGPTFGILCLVKSKRKRSMKNLRIVWTTGFVWDANATCALF